MPSGFFCYATASLQAGEFRFRFELEATEALPEPPVHLTAPLGGSSRRPLAITNPTATKATFSCSSSCPERFWVEPVTLDVSSMGECGVAAAQLG